MSRKFLLLDCDYLCHRAKYTTGELSYHGTPTGVIYGFLKGLSAYQDLFGTSNFVFCWDSRSCKRTEMYPEYKAQRDHKEYSEEETEFNNAFRKQMKKLRTTYLPRIGFKNIFIQRGYESDDIIASICDNLPDSDEAVIISSDKDLYQCIAHNISYYNPQKHKVLTLQGFKEKYGIAAVRWGLVKAYAGCHTDNVSGIEGIGEKTAIKYLLGQLNPETIAYKNITSPVGIEIVERNERLVILPFKGTECFKLRRDNLSEQGWKEVTKLLGIRSIRDKMPFGRRLR